MDGKDALRRELKARRAKITKKQKSLTSQVITNRLLKIVDWPKIKRLHIYVTIEALNEVDTLPLLKILEQRWPQITIIVADIQSPLPEDQRFEVIIVPCVGFDSQGYRLGLGGGYYDRFLAKQSQALNIGLCYQFGFIAKGLPHEPHDIPLKVVITERKLYKF